MISRPSFIVLTLCCFTFSAHAEVDFKGQIQPLFEEHCYKCHGEKKQQAGLRLDQKVAALEGGASGKVIIPGDPEDSLLIQLIAGKDPDRPMPPTDEMLTEKQIELIRQWILDDAIWPNGDTQP